MSSPKIDKRTKQDMEKQIKALATTYLPQWKTESGDAGWAVAKSFAKMSEDLIKRVNQIPTKLFIDYLDRLDFKLNPPQSAKVPVTFTLAEGTKKSKTIPENAQVSDDKEVIFESEKTLSVTPAKLSAFYRIEDGKISTHFAELENSADDIAKEKVESGSVEDINEEDQFSDGSTTISVTSNDISCYCNDIPLNIDSDEGFYPLGVEPKLYDSFYIGSKAFSSKEFTLTIELDNCPTGIEGNDTKLSWEYWNGTSWKSLKLDEQCNFINNCNEYLDNCVQGCIDEDEKGNLTDPEFNKCIEECIDAYKSGYSDCNKIISITLTNKNIIETEVNGEKNYWIRAKLIGGGYGTYLIVKDEENGSNYKTIPDFKAPLITSFTIDFTPISKGEGDSNTSGIDSDTNLGNGVIPESEITPEYIFKNKKSIDLIPDIKKSIQTKNENLDNTLLLGFDKPFGEGFISILFTLPKKYWDLHQYLEWSYYSVDGWKSLNVKDNTHGLIQTGTCEFVAPLDQMAERILAQEIFWVKIKIVEKEDIASFSQISELKQYPLKLQKLLFSKYYRKNYRYQILQKPLSYLKPCTPDLMPFHPALHIPTNEKDAEIQINGIYINTIWTSQSETITNEYVGSSDGSPNQKFRLLRPAVRELQVWVREFLEPEDALLSYYPDEEKGFWVLWSEIGYIYDAKPTARVYILDAVSGEICFGDGNFGLIPPIGKDNIKASYQTGGGKQGNVPKGKVQNLVSTVSSIDKIENHIEASGGSDVEPIESLIKRAPKTLRARDRAIIFEDYEILTKEASTDVAKVKAIPNFSNRGEYKTNWVTAVIAPYSQEKQPECSEGLIRNVKSYLEARAPMITNVQVISPKYAVIDLEIDIVLTKWDLIPIVKEEAQKKLASFLHPIYGGYKDEGWEFGTLPCFSDFFALLEKIDGIEYIKTLTMRVVAGDKTVTITSDETPVLDIAPYILACSGTHILNMEGA